MTALRTSILAAVQARFDFLLPAQAALPGGLWTGDVPEGLAMPYGVLSEGDTQFEWTFEDSYWEKGTVDIVVYAVGDAAVVEALRQFELAFDWEELDFAGDDSLLQTYPAVRGKIRGEALKDKNGDQVFSGWIQQAVDVWRE